MGTYKYKTAKGLLTHTKQLTVDEFLIRRFYHNTGKWSNFSICDSVNEEICKIIASYCVKTKSRAKDMYLSLLNCEGDTSLFQCFYIDLYKGKVIISNNLSGDAFRYCIRKYLKKYC